MSFFNRKPRSPFRGMSRGELAAFRARAQSSASWLARADVGIQTRLFDDNRDIWYPNGSFDDIRVAREFERRALDSLERQMDPQLFIQVLEVRSRLYTKRWNPKQYELMMLRDEVADLSRRMNAANL